MLKVIAYTGGNAGSRVPRVKQYIPHLALKGVELTECPSRAGVYPPDRGFWKRVRWGLWNLAEHVPATARSYDYDVTLLQREMLSTFVTFEPFTKRPRVLDVDDAIWIHRGGGFARRLARATDHVICGNRFLADWFSQWNSSVSVLPTAVDTRRFVPATQGHKSERKVIGWLGLSYAFCYFDEIESALCDVLGRHPEAVLRIVSNKSPQFRRLPVGQVEYIPYSPEREVTLLQQMTVGIMPLDDTDASRGKCSYKMIQYMSCGIPVVVSRIGMNIEVLQKGNVGFGVSTPAEWAEALETLLNNSDLCRNLGQRGRQVAEAHFDVAVLAPELAATLHALTANSTVPDPCAAS
jgi:glycosyltransferase involved in cell wall biosynthesis